MPDLLIELFSEEIPARMQARAAEDLRRMVTDGLVEAGLTYAAAGAFSTPRRLALSIEGLSAQSRAVREERKGPAVGAPDKAIEGFLRSTGLTREQLEVRDDKKGQVYFAVQTRPGRPAAAIVAEVLEATIRNFPWPKSMRWGAGSLRWVRPLHSILCILVTETGAEVVPLDVDGIVASDTTRGHRFMAPDAFSVSSFEDYEAKLKRAHVVLRADERADAIWHEATGQAFARSLEVVEDAGLLAEVAGLVEWPVVLLGDIAREFLGLPPEVLQTSMRTHQKFFSLKNPKSGRIEGFVTVANVETADHGTTILAGNGKVLTARLSDARFFWDNDLRTVKAQGLEGMAEGLTNVTFHNKLGSQADRVARIAALAREIAPMVGAAPDLAAEAARVCKADLRSEMVGEFPELQGLMGRYYAEAAGLEPAVAAACEMHWKPMGPSDAVPTEPVSIAVALADKIDTLCGFWAIDEKPTGSKDPYALRRAALGVIRIVLENGLRLHLDRLFDTQILRLRHGDEGVSGHLLGTLAAHGFHAEFHAEAARLGAEAEAWVAMVREGDVGEVSDNLVAFFHDRLKVFLRDEGIRHDIIDACLAMPNRDDLTLLVKRARALAAVLATEDGTNLVQGFKRANNILTQAEAADGVEYSFGADPKFAADPAEKALFSALDTAEAAIGPAMQAEDFAAAMAAMAALRGPIDAFFTAVQVNDPNSVLRRNRLNLLHRIRETCAQVADLTRIEG
ncbi:MAG: glycine--tRNA ligase subunit beta [Limimaricola sp.]|uniref:glycine--tRNA ligase subunit beta n=1 Tax=Limimaricola sp. TaxID=2211665 RepID=UPI001DA3223E|nr:glycine--tRNA ligase subunit beta [Limimaricola sp.]MBI1416171.1 glycine--tRNA ligase subunit beta [Limimaricola sp.]